MPSIAGLEHCKLQEASAIRLKPPGKVFKGGLIALDAIAHTA